MTVTASQRVRRAALGIVVARGVLGVVALLLAPFLYRRHFVVLVLLRPTKEVLLAAGFFLRRESVNLAEVVAAAVPLAILGVWLFYWLGRAYSEEIRSGEGLPAWTERILPPRRIQALCRVLERKGHKVLVLGRLAAFPSSLLAAAAGTSKLAPRAFLPADALGAVLSVAEALLAGYLLGAAYRRAGPWLSAVGFVALVALLVLFGRWLRRDDESDDDR